MSNSVGWNDIPAIITNVVALAAVASAVGALWVAAATRRVYQADLFLSFCDRYNSREMVESLRLLSTFYFADKSNFPNNWLQLKTQNTDEFERIDSARRHVWLFFMDIAMLRKADLISAHFAREISAHNAINIFYTVCVPINEMLNPDRGRSREYLDILRSVRTQFGDGEIFT